jgi:DUF1680 family protein
MAADQHMSAALSLSRPLRTPPPGNDGGSHANTHIPEVIGTARGYELTGNETQQAIALNFFHIVTSNHSWATGGSNDGEHWWVGCVSCGVVCG